MLSKDICDSHNHGSIIWSDMDPLDYLRNKDWF